MTATPATATATVPVTAVRLDGMKFKTAGGHFAPTGWGLRDANGDFYALDGDNFPYSLAMKGIALRLAADGLVPGYKTATPA